MSRPSGSVWPTGSSNPATRSPRPLTLATEIAALPQICLRSDRASSYDQWSLDLGAALSHETRLGRATIASGETLAGAARFAAGEGRHGQPA